MKKPAFGKVAASANTGLCVDYEVTADRRPLLHNRHYISIRSADMISFVRGVAEKDKDHSPLLKERNLQ